MGARKKFNQGGGTSGLSKVEAIACNGREENAWVQGRLLRFSEEKWKSLNLKPLNLRPVPVLVLVNVPTGR